MNSPFDDRRPKTGMSTFQRPETSTGYPIRSTMSSHPFYPGTGQENRFNERPATGMGSGISTRLYSMMNTPENKEIRSDRRFNTDNISHKDAVSTGYKGINKNILKKGRTVSHSFHPANIYSKK